MNCSNRNGAGQRDEGYYRGGPDEDEAMEDDDGLLGVEEEPEGSDEGSGDDLIENMEQ